MVPDEKMGRVFAADEASLALVPFGQLAGGLVTLLLGVRGD